VYRFFEAEMDARMQARRRLELDLRSALAAGEFELAYQPQINLEDDSIAGFEALLRWRHHERGVVPPLEFIPVAEETGLIVPIGEWVLKRACHDAAAWPSNINVAVNLSPVQFRNARLTQAVVSALDSSGLTPGRLELEITESVLLNDNDTVLNTLHHLRALGVGISMDDFGTGYSSLSYLQSFPFSKIKIDRRFVTHINEDLSSLAIVRAVTGLSASLGITTTAEGVETKEQLDRVRAEGCTEVQGFFTGRPMSVEDTVRLFQTGRRKDAIVA
jgi:EAL domain-containing protein (putative c-di-GMP-specific phosphodiesterase class I)